MECNMNTSVASSLFDATVAYVTSSASEDTTLTFDAENALHSTALRIHTGSREISTNISGDNDEPISEDLEDAELSEERIFQQKRRPKDLTHEQLKLFTLLHKASDDNTLLSPAASEWLKKFESDKIGAEQELLDLLLYCIGYRSNIDWDDLEKPLDVLQIAITELRIGNWNGSESIFDEISTNIEFHDMFGKFISLLMEYGSKEKLVMQNLHNFFVKILEQIIEEAIIFRFLAAHLVLNIFDSLLALVEEMQNCSIRKESYCDTNSRSSQEELFFNEAPQKSLQYTNDCKDCVENFVADIQRFLYDLTWDVDAKIELMCLKKWQTWISMFPFLIHARKDQKCILNHIAHPLHTVRAEAIKVAEQYIITLNGNQYLTIAAKKFYKRLKPFLSAALFDKCDDVIVSAVSLIRKVYITFPESLKKLMTGTDLKIIENFVFHKSNTVACAAGSYLNLKLVEETGDDTLAYIIGVITFYKECGLKNRMKYLVNALFCEKMTDWNTLVSLLMSEHIQRRNNFQSEDIALLVEYTVCLVRLACTRRSPLLGTQENIENIKENKTKVTNAFLKQLPKILKKYCDDEQKIGDLLSICQFFTLKMSSKSYLRLLADTTFELLLNMKGAWAVKNALHVLKLLYKTGGEIAAVCEIFVEKILHIINTSIDDFFCTLEKGEDIDSRDLERMESEFQLLSFASKEFYVGYIPGLLFLFEALLGDDVRGIPEGTIIHCINANFFLLCWDMNKNEDKVDKKINMFLDLLFRVLREIEYPSVQEMAFKVIAKTCEVVPELKFPTGGTKTYHDFIKDTIFPLIYVPEMTIEDVKSHVEKATMLLKCLCKPMSNGMLPTHTMSFLMFHQPIQLMRIQSYKPLLKLICNAVLSQVQICPEKGYITPLLTLLYFTFRELENDENVNSVEFIALQEFAVTLSISMKQTMKGFSKGVFMFHKVGIETVFSYNGNVSLKLPFLSILRAFSCKLTSEQSKTILAFLKKTRMRRRVITLSESTVKYIVDYMNSLEELQESNTNKKYIKPRTFYDNDGSKVPKKQTMVTEERQIAQHTNENTNVPKTANVDQLAEEVDLMESTEFHFSQNVASDASSEISSQTTHCTSTDADEADDEEDED